MNLHTKYTGWRANGFNVYAYSEVGTPGLSLHAGAKPFGARVRSEAGGPPLVGCIADVCMVVLKVSLHHLRASGPNSEEGGPSLAGWLYDTTAAW